MTSNDTYLAVFLGSAASPRRKAWDAMTDDERRAREQQGVAAWKGWMENHQHAIVEVGGPLGRTKRISADGVADVANDLAAFVIVRAPSHDAAAKMFEGHPHFAIFPGEAVEVMPLLSIPGA
jgi:hypothetical protein